MGGTERFMTGMGDPAIAIQQAHAHIVGTEKEAAAADVAVQQREQEIARRQGGGLLRGLGSAAATSPAMLFGGGGIPGAIAGGAVSGTLQPTLVPTGGDYWTEKGKEALIGAGMSGATAGFGRGFAGAVAPSLRPEAQALLRQGVPLTPGQMQGGWLQGAEDMLKKMPILGSFIRGAEGRGIEGYMRATYNQALEPIGQRLPDKINMGRDAFNEAASKVDAAYNKALTGINFNPDPKLGQDIHMLKLNAGVLPDAQVSHFNRIVDNYLAPLVAGPVTNPGQQFKRIDSNLSALARSYSGSSLAGERDMVHHINEFRGVLRDVLLRQNSEPQLKAIKDADRAYAMLQRVRGAATRNASSGGYFSPADMIQTIKTQDPLKKTLRPDAFARGGALMQPFAEVAFNVLPNKVPEGGFERALWDMAKSAKGITAGVLGYEGASHVGALAPYAETAALPLATGTAMAALPYTKAGQAALNRLAQQPGPTRAAAAALLKKAVPYASVGAFPTEKEFSYGGPQE